MADHQKNAQDADAQEAFVRLLTQHEAQVRAFVRACLPDPVETAEVMQNVSLIGWRKFPEQDRATIETGFGSWMCMIARYEILKFRRGKARDRLVLDEKQIERLAARASSQEGIDQRERHLDLLHICLGKLPADRQSLLRRAYAHGSSIKDLAAERGNSPDALYQLLRRLRVELAHCVEGELDREKHTGGRAHA